MPTEPISSVAYTHHPRLCDAHPCLKCDRITNLKTARFYDRRLARYELAPALGRAAARWGVAGILSSDPE